MSMIDDGGPAFPHMKPLFRYNNDGRVERVASELDGMSLRDYFAAAALTGLIAGLLTGPNAGFTVYGNCVAAYEYADAMLAERAKRQEGTS